METFELNETILPLFLRLILGILFFFQGYDKVVRIGMKGVASTFKEELGEIRLPKALLVSSAWFTSYVELIGGLLLILGLFKIPVLCILGLDVILVTAAFSLISPMWDMKYVFPRIFLLIF
ncbi:MAG: DoxX family membrane protein, partial [Crocinitomicaceae bacterium]